MALSKAEIDSLVNQYSNLVWFVLNKPKYSWLIGDDDIYQEAMIGLWQAARTYDETKSKFITYATTCIINNIKRELRRRAIQRQQETVSLEKIVSTTVDGVSMTLQETIPAPSCFADSLSEWEIVLDQFFQSTNLSSKYRAIFLRHIYGETQQEIADTLNYTRSYICAIIKKVQEQLKSFLLKNSKEYADIFHD